MPLGKFSALLQVILINKNLPHRSLYPYISFTISPFKQMLYANFTHIFLENFLFKIYFFQQFFYIDHAMQFLNQISQMRPFRKAIGQEVLNDKLFMFDKVDQLSQDPEVMKQFNQLIKKRKEMFKAIEKMEKVKKLQ